MPAVTSVKDWAPKGFSPYRYQMRDNNGHVRVKGYLHHQPQCKVVRQWKDGGKNWYFCQRQLDHAGEHRFAPGRD